MRRAARPVLARGAFALALAPLLAGCAPGPTVAANPGEAPAGGAVPAPAAEPFYAHAGRDAFILAAFLAAPFIANEDLVPDYATRPDRGFSATPLELRHDLVRDPRGVWTVTASATVFRSDALAAGTLGSSAGAQEGLSVRAAIERRILSGEGGWLEFGLSLAPVYRDCRRFDGDEGYFHFEGGEWGFMDRLAVGWFFRPRLSPNVALVVEHQDCARRTGVSTLSALLEFGGRSRCRVNVGYRVVRCRWGGGLQDPDLGVVEMRETDFAGPAAGVVVEF